MKPFLFAAALMAANGASAQTLTVLAPDYFGSEWGPGPAIKEGFEARCDCTLEYRTGDVLPRLMLEGARLDADAVIGLNTDMTLRARDTGLFAPHGQPLDALTVPVDWTMTPSSRSTGAMRPGSMTRPAWTIRPPALPNWSRAMTCR